MCTGCWYGKKHVEDLVVDGNNINIYFKNLRSYIKKIFSWLRDLYFVAEDRNK